MRTAATAPASVAPDGYRPQQVRMTSAPQPATVKAPRNRITGRMRAVTASGGRRNRKMIRVAERVASDRKPAKVKCDVGPAESRKARRDPEASPETRAEVVR